eukprot:jgi/Botrbrau1/18616/Bobra.0367s0055.1
MTDIFAAFMNRPNLRVLEADGMRLVEDWARYGDVADILIVDAFDGEDAVPSALTCEGSPFLSGANRILHPEHGMLLMNIHSGPKMSIPSKLKRAFSGMPDPGFEPSSMEGREISRIAGLLRDALLKCNDQKGGVAFTVACRRQQNITLAAARGFPLRVPHKPEAQTGHTNPLSEAGTFPGGIGKGSVEQPHAGEADGYPDWDAGAAEVTRGENVRASGLVNGVAGDPDLARRMRDAAARVGAAAGFKFDAGVRAAAFLTALEAL